MDALTLLSLYLISKNPDFKENLCSFTERIKQSEDMLQFLKSLSVFPCAPNGKECEANKPPDAPPDCKNPPPPCDSAIAQKPQARENGYARTPDAPQSEETTSPIASVGGEWLEKYVTQYLRK